MEDNCPDARSRCLLQTGWLESGLKRERSAANDGGDHFEDVLCLHLHTGDHVEIGRPLDGGAQVRRGFIVLFVEPLNSLFIDAADVEWVLFLRTRRSACVLDLGGRGETYN